MRLYPSRQRAGRSATALLTVALYATGVGLLPVLHAVEEVARSAASVEAAHSDSCPALHAGAVCAAVAGLSAAHTGRSPATPVQAPASAHPHPGVAERLGTPAPSQPHPARAPPLV